MMNDFRPFPKMAHGTILSAAALLLLGATAVGAQTSDSSRKTMMFGVVPADPSLPDTRAPDGSASQAGITGPMVTGQPSGMVQGQLQAQDSGQAQAQAQMQGQQPQGAPGQSQPQPAAPQTDASGSSLSAVQAGLLECRGEFATGYGFGSSRKVSCVFQPSAGEVHYYVGTLERVGLDIGISDQASMLWAVLATSRTLQPGALAGRYVGVSSGFSLGPGFSANMLASADASRQITLQPLSVSSDSGLSLSITGATLTLTPSATRPR